MTCRLQQLGLCDGVLPLMASTPLSAPFLCCSAQQPRERPWAQSCGGEGGDPSHSEEAQGSSRVSRAEDPPVRLFLVSFLHPSFLYLMCSARC